ncbi:PSMD2 [Mytilus coruscus]|uniref:PSMD2 n=1 Tax=Mytilus coruscus TaxID=42192 RepID=A0A6J8AIU1_MYTCO|nr:PSMD2 [Mytilus coruscus]
MASCIDLVPWARLHMRPLQLYLLAWWRPALHSLNHLIPLYQPLQEHLFWWLNRRNFFQGSVIRTGICSGDSCDRCVTVGMGSSYKQLSDSRCLATSVQSETHQLAKTQSCAVSTANFSNKSTIQKCASENRQCNCRQLSEQTGRYPIPRPLLLGMGSFEMVHKSQCQNPSRSYSGEKEYYSRCPVKGENDHSFDRMGIKYDNSEFVVPSARNTSNRSVCDFNEQEAASVLLSLAGRNSSVNRCTVDEMDRSICLCLPSTDNSKQSITKNTERGLCNFTDSANVAETVVVQSTSQPVNRLSNTTACPTKSIKSKWNSSSKSKCSKSCSLESVKRSYTAKGFSPKIASIISNARKKQSTQTVYNARLKLFDSWCQERRYQSQYVNCTRNSRISYVFLHTVKNCKPSTLAGYKSAIALIHSSKDRISINMDLRNLIKGLYNINPPIRQLAPNWDLSLVLLVLTKTPFEPLEEAELKYLTLKTVFLMALASAARVSELHSFTINDKHFRKEQKSYFLPLTHHLWVYAANSFANVFQTGTGNVLKIQKLQHICSEHDEKKDEDNNEKKDDKKKKDEKEKEKDKSKETATSDLSAQQSKLRYGETAIKRAVPVALGLISVSNPKLQILDTLSKFSHDNDPEVAHNAILAMGLVGAGTNNARLAAMLRQLAVYHGKDANNLFMVRLAQGLTHLGKGTLTLSPYHSDKALMSPVAVAGLLAVCVSCLDVKNLILGKSHYILYHLVSAMQPRMLTTFDEELRPTPVHVRVGQAVDVVGQAGKPKSITGFQTHTTPVLLAYGERAELATEEYLPISPIMEGFVILKKNPDYEA